MVRNKDVSSYAAHDLSAILGIRHEGNIRPPSHADGGAARGAGSVPGLAPPTAAGSGGQKQKQKELKASASDAGEEDGEEQPERESRPKKRRAAAEAAHA